MIRTHNITAYIYVLFILLTLTATRLTAAESTSAQYRLGPEDVINITVLGHAEFSGDFYIPADGVLNLPVTGQIKAVGKTPEEIAGIITDKLHHRLKAPEVSVSIRTPREQRVYVMGAVQNPGYYNIKSGWKITEAVAAAGGLGAEVDVTGCKATILRAQDKEKHTVDLQSALSGKEEYNLIIKSGDVLLIDEDSFPVYIMGKVKNPGCYKVKKKSDGIMEALSLAGGSTDDAALSKVNVTHLSGKSEKVDISTAISGENQAKNLKLSSGDLVVVPEITDRIAILGYVKDPGFYPMKEGQKLTLVDALGLAKGADNHLAGMEYIALIRTVNGTQSKQTYNIRKFLKDGDITNNPCVTSGDVIYVPRSGKADWDSILRATSVIGIFVNPLL